MRDAELKSYSSFLREELTARSLRNKQYSTRAFARDLDLSAPFLIQILNGKRFLKTEKAQLIAEKLKWNSLKTQSFIRLLNYETTKDKKLKDKLFKELQSKKFREIAFYKISEEDFMSISSWYCFAILELTLIKDFIPDASWIAQRLEIGKEETTTAINKLFALGLLVEKDGKWVKTQNDFTTSHGTVSRANRVFHNQILGLAQKKLESSPIDQRAFSSITLVGDPNQMEKWKKKILEFRDEMMLEVEATESKAVYQLSIQLLRLDEGTYAH